MVPECRHIKTSGGKCGSPALRGQPYCYFHSRLKQRMNQSSSACPIDGLSKELANLEDRGAIQHAVTEVATAVADFRIDTKRAGILLYALQIASGNAKDAGQIVSTDAIDEITQTGEGEEMAPEGAIAGPPEEESLATLLMRELRRHHQENQQFSPDQIPELIENEEFTGKSVGEGEGAWDL